MDKSKLVNPFSWKSIKEFYKNLVSLKGKPSRIAMSMAIGIFFGIFMPVGFQLIFTVPICVYFNLNVIVASTATFVTNPLTVLPLYVGIVKLGEFLTQIHISWFKFEKLIDNPTIDNLLNLGADSLIVFFSGSLFTGTISAILIYLITLKLIKNYRLKNNSNL